MKPFAFVFPGQGSQAVGMLDAWGDHPAVREVLTEAADTLGENLGQLIAQGPKDLLDLTTNTQPVMLAASIACYRAWLAEGGAEPVAVAGHSLGEYSALVAAGVLTLRDALPLVRFRAQAMQTATPVGSGAMAAVLGLDDEAVVTGCAEAQSSFGADSVEVVQAANFNGPGQVVISGSKAAVDKACDILKAKGAKRALPLAVSAPFHSALMKPAADELADRLESVSFAAPRMAMVNNIDVAVEVDPERIRDALVRQAYGPVRWTACVQAIAARGVTHLVECGPGKVLAGMTKRIDASLVGSAMFDPASLAATKEMLA
jgi:[acyl-carrier-protein] S-malonyltransferase